MENNYISIAEASKICTYEQEYLSLLARRGLLHAEKIGKKWYTTTEWLNEYLKLKRPNEIIKDTRNEKKSAYKIKMQMPVLTGKWIFAASFIAIGVVISGYWYTAHKVNELEKKASENKFILNEIVKVPDDQGNINVYGSGMVKINGEAPLSP